MPAISFNTVQPPVSVTPSDATQPALAKEIAEHIVRIHLLEQATAESMDKTLTPDGMSTTALTQLLATTTVMDRQADTLSSWLRANGDSLKQLSRNIQPPGQG